MTTDQFFRRPALRAGVATTRDGETFRLEYRLQGCTLTVPEPAGDQFARLLSSLSEGASEADLAAGAPGFRDRMPELLRQLDHLGLLTEGADLGTAAGHTGTQLYGDVRRHCGAFLKTAAGSRFERAATSGDIEVSQLIGYAIEYYHVVRMSPGLIGPSLAHAGSRRSQRLLESFLQSEIGHDRLLASALASVGVTEDELLRVVPLPATFAVCATLGVFAAQDPLSFKAALFLFEEPTPEFQRALAAAARGLELPDEFTEPLLRHANLNEDYGHDDMSRELLADVPFVSDEERLVVLRNVLGLAELLVRLEDEILDHYAGGTAIDARMPR
ncbi:MAG TPA: iron-containing redox enzyme family protein [Mycobacteriales bacterium]|jgi:hypothetical protein|nr:iron-containing redox enzyme family protein [Mycobacteriales bacterium]